MRRSIKACSFRRAAFLRKNFWPICAVVESCGMKKLLTLWMGLFSLALLTVSQASAEIKLDGYHTYPAHKFWQDELAKRYMEKHPDVTITYRAPGPTYNEALLTIARQALINQQPDFHLCRMHLLREFVARGLVQPFDDLLQGKDMAALGYYKEILAQGQIDGKQYALPWGVSTPVIFVNTDLVRQAGGDPSQIPANGVDFINLSSRVAALAPR
jgi:multiple sugar transport system substrate-binding protein